jgi:hypothetical protein
LAVQKTLKVYDVFKIPKKSSQVFRFGSGAGPYFVRFQLVDASDNWVELSAERKDAKDKTALPTYTYLFNTIHDGTTRTVAGLIKAAGNRIDIMAESLGGDPVPRADAAGAVFSANVYMNSTYIFNFSKGTYQLERTELFNGATTDRVGELIITDISGKKRGSVSKDSAGPIAIPPGISRMFWTLAVDPVEKRSGIGPLKYGDKNTFKMFVTLSDAAKTPLKFQMTGSDDGFGLLLTTEKGQDVIPASTMTRKIPDCVLKLSYYFDGDGSVSLFQDGFPKEFVVKDKTRP